MLTPCASTKPGPPVLVHEVLVFDVSINMLAGMVFNVLSAVVVVFLFQIYFSAFFVYLNFFVALELLNNWK